MTVNYTTNLALGLPVTGTESGTWGDDVNNAITAYLDIAIAGGLSVAITTADVTLSLTQGTSSATGITSTTAQYAILNISGAKTAARSLIVPSSSRYYIINNTAATGGYLLTVKGAATIGITLVDGEKAVVAWNGSDYVKIASSVLTNFTGILPVANGGTGVTTSTGTGNVVLSTSPTLVTPALGTPASGVLTNATGLPLTTGVTGILPVANGGTGVTTSTGTGNVVLSTSPTLVTPALGTPASGVLTNATGLPLTTGVTGVLPVANGGTGLSAGTSGGVPYYSATGTIASSAALTASALVLGGGAGVAPATTTTGTGVVTALGVNVGSAGAVVVNGGVLGTPSSGTATNLTGLPLTTGVTGTLPVANGGTGVTTSTGTGNVVLSTSPTLVTPLLGTPTSVTLTNATGLPISTGVAGLGTGVATFLATPSSANLAAALTDETGTGANVFATSPTLVTPLLGTPTSGNLANCTFPTLNQNTTGTAAGLSATLAVASGGTGAATLTANNVLLGNGTSALQTIAPSTSGNVLTSNGTTWASTAPTAPYEIFPITASVASSALTATLNPIALDFRSSTLTSGTVNRRTVSSAISVVVPSTATLGTVNATQSRIIVLAIDNAGTVELAVVNIAGGNNLDETTLISTTAISTAADSDNVIYSTTARTSVAFRVVGYIESTQATAGTWATAPSTIQGAGGNALTAMSSLGYGQTINNVTSSRAYTTTYYNTTSKPITVAITAISAAGSGAAVLLRIGGFDTMNPYVGVITGTVNNICVFGVVPVGQSYQIIPTFNTPTITIWAELR